MTADLWTSSVIPISPVISYDLHETYDSGDYVYREPGMSLHGI